MSNSCEDTDAIALHSSPSPPDSPLAGRSSHGTSPLIPQSSISETHASPRTRSLSSFFHLDDWKIWKSRAPLADPEKGTECFGQSSESPVGQLVNAAVLAASPGAGNPGIGQQPAAESVRSESVATDDIPPFEPYVEVNRTTVVRNLDAFATGYPNLAVFADSDDNFMLYRRFGYLQARMLLQKQSEMGALERELDQLDDTDQYDQPDTLDSVDRQGDKRKELLEQIEMKFMEYSNLLVAAQTLNGFNKPLQSEHQSVFNYLWKNKTIRADEASYVRHKEDLISIKAGREHGWLDQAIEKVLRDYRCGWIERLFRSKETMSKTKDKTKVVYYSKSRISACALTVVTLTVLFLLIVPTYLLFHLVNQVEGQMSNRRANSLCICVLFLFTLVFSVALSTFTNARRHEILASAAAYCAVLVVFLGNLGTSPHQ